MHLQEDFSLVHYIDDVMLIVCKRQGEATSLDLLVKHLGAGRWEINPTKTEGLSTSLKL